MKITIPDYVNKAVSRLENAGFECFIVGGCVRDALSGRLPHDYDLTTSALPEQMLGVFSDFNVIKTGLKHGTLTVISDGEALEITTYRTDGVYSDNRRPDSVSFTRDIADDLSRRDFTVNAMAYSDKRGLFDLFGGENDLKNRIIRCVGNPDRRFCEDGLRIMRGLRFAAVLGFEIDRETADAMHRNRELLENIAAERIYSEFARLVCGAEAHRILGEFSDVIGVFIPELEECRVFDEQNGMSVCRHMLRTLSFCEPDLCLCLAAYLHNIGKPRACEASDGGISFPEHGRLGAELAETVLRRLKTDNETCKNVTRLIAGHSAPVEPDEKWVRRLMSRSGEAEARRTLELAKAIRLAHSEDGGPGVSDIDLAYGLMNRIIDDDACYSLKTLAVRGGDIAALGFGKKEIGSVLDALLAAVIDGIVPNDRATLTEYAKSLMNKGYDALK